MLLIRGLFYYHFAIKAATRLHNKMFSRVLHVSITHQFDFSSFFHLVCLFVGSSLMLIPCFLFSITKQKAPLSWFTTIPVGNLLNCFSKDQAQVDELLVHSQLIYCVL